MRALISLFSLFAALLVAGGCKRPPTPEPAASRPCAPAPLTKGPWVTRPSETAATLVWESKAQGCVEVAFVPEAGGEERFSTGASTAVEVKTGYGQELAEVKQKDEAGTFQMNEVRLDALKAGTCYRYRLGSTPAEEGRFCTAKEAGQPFSFVALGDSAIRWKDAQKVAARAVAERTDFVLHAGDIQYYASLLETWQEWFGEMAPLLRAGAFLPCIGNHEDEIPGELSDYYLRLFSKPGQTDTARWYRFSSGGVHFFSLDTESPLSVGSEQWTWFKQEAAAAKATAGFRFSVVYFHKPIYSLARHGPLLPVREAVEPLLAPASVKLVIQGHNHVYERFEKDGVTFLVTGGGGAPLYDVNESVGSFPQDVPFRKAGVAAHHFVRVDVEAGRFRGQAIGIDGGVLDAFEHPLP